MIADDWATGQMMLYQNDNQRMDTAQDVAGPGFILSSMRQGRVLPAIADAAQSQRRQIGAILGWTASYLLAGILVAHNQPDADSYLWYPSIAIGAAFLMHLGLRFWPAAFLADLAVSSYQQGGDPVAALITSGSVTLEIVATVAILQVAKLRPGVPSYRDLAVITFACLGASLFGATLMSILSDLHSRAPDIIFLDLWLARWLGNATSGISLLPAILVLCSNAGPGKVGATPRPSRIAWEEIATISMALAVSYVVFGRDALLPHMEQDALRPLIVVPILWAVVRGHARTAAAAILATVISAVVFHWSIHSLGSGGDDAAGHAVLALQISLVASAVVGSALSHAIEKERNSRVRAQAHELELKQVADELQTSLTRLSLAAEAGKAGVWDWNLVDNSLVWDDAVFEMYQIARDANIDKYAAWVERVHPNDVAGIESEIDESMKSGCELRSTFRVRLPDGDIRHFNTHAVIAEWSGGKATRMIGIDYDVTDLVRQRIATEESQARLQAIFDIALVGIINVDERFRINGYNLEAEAIFGWPASEMMGQTLDRLVPPEARTGHQQMMEGFLRGTAVRQSMSNWRRVTGLRSDGSIVPLMAVLSKVQIGDHTTLTVMFRDMTEIERSEDALRRLAAEKALECEKAAAANKAKSEFLAVMSHELRTPLNAIIGFSDLMVGERLGPMRNDQYKAFSNDIMDSGKLLLSLINDILDLTRIESGKFDLSSEPVDPHDLSHEIAGLLAPHAEAKRITLAVAPAIDVPPILGDRRALRQLLNNLVGNGIKFTNQGGVVNLATQAGAAPDTVVLVVSDNGRGIPKERIPDLGRPFVQVSDSLRRDIGGLGLGLAIARSLTEAMDGRLEIESDLGIGTTVRVTLPSIRHADATLAPVN